jgi:hypothetical protein
MTHDEQKAIVQQYVDHIAQSDALYKEGLLWAERSQFFSPLYEPYSKKGADTHPKVKAHMAVGSEIPYWMIARLSLLCLAENTLEYLYDVERERDAGKISELLSLVQEVPTMEGEDVRDHVVAALGLPLHTLWQTRGEEKLSNARSRMPAACLPRRRMISAFKKRKARSSRAFFSQSGGGRRLRLAAGSDRNT